MSSDPRRLWVREPRRTELPDAPLSPQQYERLGEMVGLLVEDAYRLLRDRTSEQRRRQPRRRRRLPDAA